MRLCSAAFRARAEVSEYLISAGEPSFVEPGGVKKQPLRRIRGRMKNTDDPIIAMIEAHRRACVKSRAAFEHQSTIENELVAEPAGEAEYNPRWIAANDVAGKALAVQDDLAVKLLETQPTTIAGAAALLTYYVDAVTTTQPEVVFPELDGNGRPFKSKLIDEPRRDFAYFMVRNVAAALSNMAAAGEAVEQYGAAGARRQQGATPRSLISSGPDSAPGSAPFRALDQEVSDKQSIPAAMRGTATG
jgi:hypothetical protein